MSQIVTRNSAVAEEKDKPIDSPAKDTKKKMAATDKESEKPVDKSDKSVDKKEKPDKHDNEMDKSTDKKADKKSDTLTEKTKEDSNKGEKNVKEKPKDGKVQKHKEEILQPTDRKLRSADSPKPGEKKTLDKPHDSKKLKEKTPEPMKKTPEPPKKTQDSPKKGPGSPKKVPGSPKKSSESPTKVRDGSKDREPVPKLQEEKENGVKEIEVEVEIVVDSDGSQDEPRKLDTNYSKSRVKVSPYRRSMRLADQTTSSVMANYTGNNTTMEMDITETSSYVSITEEPSVDESPYLSGLRNIRGRRSYKPLKEMALRHVTANKSGRSANVSVPEIPSRPTGTVVGRKRKPDGEEEPVEKVDLTAESDDLASVVRSKRMRLLDRISHPFKRTLASTPIPRRAAEIVGINTDLPLTAPVDPEPFDPESLKPAADVTSETTELTQTAEKDNKRCVVM